MPRQRTAYLLCRQWSQQLPKSYEKNHFNLPLEFLFLLLHIRDATDYVFVLNEVKSLDIMKFEIREERGCPLNIFRPRGVTIPSSWAKRCGRRGFKTLRFSKILYQ